MEFKNWLLDDNLEEGWGKNLAATAVIGGALFGGNKLYNSFSNTQNNNISNNKIVQAQNELELNKPVKMQDGTIAIKVKNIGGSLGQAKIYTKNKADMLVHNFYNSPGLITINKNNDGNYTTYFYKIEANAARQAASDMGNSPIVKDFKYTSPDAKNFLP